LMYIHSKSTVILYHRKNGAFYESPTAVEVTLGNSPMCKSVLLGRKTKTAS